MIAVALAVVAGAIQLWVPSPHHDATVAKDRPRRVMSISECTDQLVLALVPPDRIVSVTWLSRDPVTSLMARAAAGVPVNHGLAEEVLRDAPDLVVADSFATPATRALLRRLHVPMIEVASTGSVAEIRTATRQVARAVGASPRGEALLARMDRQWADLAHHPGPSVRVAAWDGGGFGAARGGLFDAVLTAAGAINIVPSAGPPDPERLLVAAPALLVRGSGGAPDLRANVADHPVVRAAWPGSRSVTVPAAAYFCGTPFIGDAALAVRDRLRAAATPAATPAVAR
ncbi:MAG: ABC transporter substrate-binding protein [Sphingomonadaceae bacterium]|nr:ABC transporter substrate-binding protein [Sphingomonadaceae bacterium]